jgi:hypothetical protein
MVFSCGYDGERGIVRADGEIFESVVRSQISDGAEASASATSPLRFDSRPAGDNAELAASPEKPQRLELGVASDSLSVDARRVIVERRKDILKSLRIEEGGPFNYPECGGARTRRAQDSSGLMSAAKCPALLRRYVTVGLPYRGAAEILARVRPAGAPAPDTTGETWTVLVTESSVGPGGQQWRQYISLFRPDPVDGRLGLVERFLLSWAE